MALYKPDVTGIGIDYSANPTSLSGLTLLATIPEQRGRHAYYIQALSAAGLQVVFDGLDGDGSFVTSTVITLANTQSLTMGMAHHTGRIRIYSSNPSASFAARTWGGNTPQPAPPPSGSHLRWDDGRVLQWDDGRQISGL